MQLLLSEKRLTGAFEGKFEGPVNLSSFGSLSCPGVLLNNYNFRSNMTINLMLIKCDFLKCGYLYSCFVSVRSITHFGMQKLTEPLLNIG